MRSARTDYFPQTQFDTKHL